MVKVILINKLLLGLTAVAVGVAIFSPFLAGYGRALTVYKDREFWEKTGDIVWEVKTGEKLLALTFDDGPSPTFTGRILDLLERYRAKATFFVIGSRAELYPEILQRQAREGHEIGNHTYAHREVNRISEEELRLDLYRAHQVIHEITGENMRLFRPTSGFYNETIVRVAKALGYEVVIWTWGQDSRDWTPVSGEQIARKILNNVKPGDIILFHDQGGDRSNTLQALRILLPVLEERGYRFVTVAELLRAQKEKQMTRS